MGRPQWDSEPHTLAQLARRAGISEGRVRALFTAQPSGLPRPDRGDADGRPLWSPGTIDAWCASTGRTVSEAALWLFHVDKATGPPAELRRGLVELPSPRGWGEQRRFFHIIWDTDHGHLIYLLPIDHGDHYDWIAEAAAGLIEPRWWSSAVVVMPFPEAMPFDEPIAYIYRLVEPDDAGGGSRSRLAGAEGSAFAGLRRWLARVTDPDFVSDEDAQPSMPVSPRAEWVTHLTMEEIARPLGTRLPVWITGTVTEEHIIRSLAYGDRTFTVPDTTTDWSAVQRRVDRALEAGVDQKYPAAWAVLAVDAADRLRAIREAHAEVADGGPGWYLVARPAGPQVPVALETRLNAAELVEDPQQIGDELTALRTVEADLDIDDPDGEVYAEAINLLSLQLAKLSRDDTLHPVPELSAVLDRTLVHYTSAWSGSVVEEWKKTLRPVQDVTAALRLRRVRRLIGDGPTGPGELEFYRDAAGRYVVMHPPISFGEEPSYDAEWPASLDAVAGWTDRTILAADKVSNTTTLMALTPTDDGGMQVDPVPMPRGTGRTGFAFGYGGGGPAATYMALLRCALSPAEHRVIKRLHPRLGWRVGTKPVRDTEDSPPASQLWTAIVTTRGPLQLSWPKAQQWAFEDLEVVRGGRG